MAPVNPDPEVDLVRAFYKPSILKLIPDGFEQRCANKSNFGEVRFSQANSLISKAKVFVKTLQLRDRG